MKYEPMRDCKFYNEKKHQCNGLKELYCVIEEKPCSFYKQKESEENVNENN